MAILNPVQDAYPLRWWSPDHLSQVATAMEKLVLAWSQDWSAHTFGEAGADDCIQACERPEWAQSVHWAPAAVDNGLDAGPGLWWGAEPGARQDADTMDRLIQAMFGPPAQLSAAVAVDATEETAVEAAKAAWADLWRRIGLLWHVPTLAEGPAAAAVEPAFVRPPAQWFKPWAGAILVRLRVCGTGLVLLVSGSEMETFMRGHRAWPAPSAGQAPRIVPLWDAVAPIAARIRAELRPVELSLGAIHALRTGDVVELSHALDTPLQARTEQGALLCEAFLGKSGGHRAIEVLSAPSQAQ